MERMPRGACDYWAPRGRQPAACRQLVAVLVAPTLPACSLPLLHCCRSTSIGGSSSISSSPLGTLPRLKSVQQRPALPTGSGTWRPRQRCARGTPSAALRGGSSAIPAAAAPSAARAEAAAATAPTPFSSVATRGGGSLRYRPSRGGMGAGHSSHGAAAAPQGVTGAFRTSGSLDGGSSSMPRSRRMVLLSAAAPAAAEAVAETEKGGVTVDFDNDSGKSGAFAWIFLGR